MASSSATFRPGNAADYAHQTADQITIGAKAYDNPDLIEAAFGKKVDLLKYGITPVLVVVENKSTKTIDLRNIQVNLVASDGRHVSAVNPEDIPFVGGSGQRPKQVPLPVPLPKKKNPLNSPEIVTRAFSARMLPAGDSASGFFYFEAKPEADDSVYLDGLRETPSGKDILYFEFPLKKSAE